MTKEVILYATKADDNGKVQNYEVTKSTKGKIELRKCESNDINRNYHRNKTVSKSDDDPNRRMSKSTMQSKLKRQQRKIKGC